MKKIIVNPDRIIGARDEKIYGQFIEHFHRIVYGGIYDPDSSLSDKNGLRLDVLAALKKIKVPVIRWPGGCFVSAYDWKKGVGKNRIPYFDKAWRVEESNEFGTDEFLHFSEMVGAEPYICANAGTGTPEEISDWVEYCNLENQGIWAKERIKNGHTAPYKVKYWSVGNENYGSWEIGAKSPAEWGRYVKEAVKMMKRVDPTIEVMAANVVDLDWNIQLLKEAGDVIDWISIHGYWDPIHQENNPASYETAIAQIPKIEEHIRKAESFIGTFGYTDKIKIAFDEWNLRGWHHPNIHKNHGYTVDEYLTPRDLNDLNQTYTMADAVFSASFLNCCLRHCNTVKMANFAPTVNVRGAVYTHENGIVLRPTYHVFDLFVNYMGEKVIDSYSNDNCKDIDMAATVCRNGAIAISLVNLNSEESSAIEIEISDICGKTAVLHMLNGDTKDSYNDVGAEDRVVITEGRRQVLDSNRIKLELASHSVNVLVIE